jgi:hypothetical protein
MSRVSLPQKRKVSENKPAGGIPGLSREATTLLSVLDEVDRYGVYTKPITLWFVYSHPLLDWFLEKDVIDYHDMRFLYEDLARKIRDICNEAGVSCTVYWRAVPLVDRPTYIISATRNGKTYTLYVEASAPSGVIMLDEKRKRFNAWVYIERAFNREVSFLEHYVRVA